MRPVMILLVIVDIRKSSQSDLHIINPFRSAVVYVGRTERSDIVRLPKVIPGYDLNKARTLSKKISPPCIPQQITRK